MKWYVQIAADIEVDWYDLLRKEYILRQYERWTKNEIKNVVEWNEMNEGV